MAKHRVDFVLNAEEERLLADMIKYYDDMTQQQYFRRAVQIGMDELLTMYLEEIEDEEA